MEPTLDRRRFLTQTVGGAAFASSIAWTATSYAKIAGANDRIRVGLIGAGDMGSNHAACLHDLSESNNVEAVAVADCWLTRAQKAATTLNASHTYQDYRRVLDHDIDYVTIATPEHWHRQMICDAFDAEKAVYCEKPMTHTIEEGLAVAEKQKRTGLPLQVGVQATSDDIYRRAGKAIRDGVLGTVVQAQTEYVRRHDEQGPWRKPDRVKANRQLPPDLDWKAWLGHAQERSWNPHHYFEWRNYAAYSGGIATDLFIHRITRIMIACDLLYPNRVVGMGGIWQWHDGRDLPDNFEMICEYPRGMTVYCLGTQSNRVPIDHLIRGYRGTMEFSGNQYVVKDKDGKVLAQEEGDVKEDIHKHHSNFHNHLRHGEPLNCPLRLGMAGVVAVCMANESWRMGNMMAWDDQQKKMVPATQRLLAADETSDG